MRSDMLVSVVVVDEQGPEKTLPRLAGVLEVLGASFRYFELVYVVAESTRPALNAMAVQIAQMPNLRIILASDGTRY